MIDQKSKFVGALQDLRITADILRGHLVASDEAEAHEAVTVLLMQGMHHFGADSGVMKQFFPVFDSIKKRLDAGNSAGALGQTQLLQTQLGEIIDLVSRQSP